MDIFANFGQRNQSPSVLVSVRVERAVLVGWSRAVRRFMPARVYVRRASVGTPNFLYGFSAPLKNNVKPEREVVACVQIKNLHVLGRCSSKCLNTL